MAAKRLLETIEPAPQPIELLGDRAAYYLRAVLENLGAGALLIEGDERRLVLANRALAELTRLSVSEILQLSRAQFVDHLVSLAEDPDSLREALGRIPAQGPYAARSRFELVRPHRRVIDWEVRPVPLPQGIGQLCIFRDVTLEASASEALQRLADIDALTGLQNRRVGLEALEREIARTERSSGPLCLALIDLDHFKHINDALGHEAGDEVLRQVGERLQQCSRKVDLVVRWGGEELLVLLPDCPLQGGRALAERLRLAVENLPSPGAGLRVTASVGIAAHRPSETAAQLLRRVDELLYRAKAAGRNRVELEDDRPGGLGKPG